MGERWLANDTVRDGVQEGADFSALRAGPRNFLKIRTRRPCRPSACVTQDRTKRQGKGAGLTGNETGGHGHDQTGVAGNDAKRTARIRKEHTR